MNAHTPGPWEFEEQPGDEWWFGDGGQIVIRAAGGKTWDSFAVMSAEDNGRANARLIAAAPELLKALIACAEQLEMITGKVHDERCAWIDARVAIAKATGEQA